MNRRAILSGFAALSALGGVARAHSAAEIAAETADRADARSRVETLARWADTLLANDGLTPDAARAAFADVVDGSFDIHRIARLVLGRHWRTAGEIDRQRFQALVRREIVDGFGRNLSYFRGRRLVVTETRPLGPGDVDVSTAVGGTGLPSIPVTFRLQRRPLADGPFRIVDIQVLGFSLLTAQRQAVDARVQSYGSVPAMLAALGVE